MSGRGRGGGRGGGGRGRGQEYSPRGQPSPSFPRGGGGGRGRGRDFSRGRRSPGSPPPYASPPAHVAPTRPPPPYAPQTSSSQQYQASSSSAGESLSREVSQKLTLEQQAVTTERPLPPAKEMPSRPGRGRNGRPCRVIANHFLVDVANMDLHHYDVSITPEITSKKVNRDIIKELIELYQMSHLGGRCPAYDGRKSLYTAGALPFESNNFTVKLIEEVGSGSSSSSPRKERQFKVTIKMASKPDLHFLQEFLCTRQPECPQETIQALDVVLRVNPSKKYNVVGRSFFKPILGGKGELGGGTEYWMGYYQSLRPTQMGLSLNIDVSARSFYEEILVTEFVEKYLRHVDLSRPLSDQDRIKVTRALKGLKVKLNHMEYARTCKIVSLSREPIGKLTFTLDDRTTNVSVVQYFRDRYNILVKYASLPALQCGSEAKPVYYPMELCTIVEGQRYTKKLNDQQVRALLKTTCQHPIQRAKNIQKMVETNNFKGDKLVTQEFGIRVREELALVDARVLPPPMLKYHDSGQERSVKPGFGAWNMTNKKMVNGGEVKSWTCVNFSKVHAGKTGQFCTAIKDMCESKGIRFWEKPSIRFRAASPDRIDQTLLDVYKDSLSLKEPLNLLIIILPDKTGSYGKIKRICETELGIVSQCCQAGKAAHKGPQYFENLALKINVKVGGRNTLLLDAFQRNHPFDSEKTTIIFGADVTHPQPGEDSSSSIAAVVASMDWPEVTNYRGVVSAQPHREEIIQDLYKLDRNPQKGLVHSGMIRELLIAFYSINRRKPQRIIFYRDGVSEGQFSQVLLSELGAIQKACSSLEEGYKPDVTFVVVQKRHRTRLFAANPNQTDRSGNIHAGTVVDTSICHPREFDFYLNSHAGIQGTSKPTHYHVLIDENFFTADELQGLTNNLCYTYARCTRAVSIVPPVYYAHLLAFRARYYIEDDTSESGSNDGGLRATNRNVRVRSLPSVKENVKSCMFFC